MSIRVLKKSHDKVYSGVCAGIAEFYGWQPKTSPLLIGLSHFLHNHMIGTYKENQTATSLKAKSASTKTEQKLYG